MCVYILPWAWLNGNQMSLSFPSALWPCWHTNHSRQLTVREKRRTLNNSFFLSIHDVERKKEHFPPCIYVVVFCVCGWIWLLRPGECGGGGSFLKFYAATTRKKRLGVFGCISCNLRPISCNMQGGEIPSCVCCRPHSTRHPNNPSLSTKQPSQSSRER